MKKNITYNWTDLKLIEQVLKEQINSTNDYFYAQELTTVLKKTEQQIKSKSIKVELLKGGKI